MIDAKKKGGRHYQKVGILKSVVRFPGTRHALWLFSMMIASLGAAGSVSAQATQPVSLGFFGTPGLIDMPTAEALPDGQLSVTVAHMPNITRNTVTFQITPRLTGSFRYSLHGNPVFNFDRSFDVHYILRRESGYLPSLAIGLRDLVGTGCVHGFASRQEYRVISKGKVKIPAGRIGNIWRNVKTVFGRDFRRFGGCLGLKI